MNDFDQFDTAKGNDFDQFDEVSPVSPVGQTQTPAAGSNPPAAGQSVLKRTLNMLSNVPGSAVNLAKNVASSVAHPINTVNAMGELLSGELSKAAATIAGRDSAAEAEKYGSQHENEVANALNNRYNSVDAALNTLENDPVGVAADLAPGLSVASKVASVLPKGATAANALRTTAEAINPINAAAKTSRLAADGAGSVLTKTLGATTGAGEDAIRQAYKSGLEGEPTFRANQRGKVNPGAVVETARKGVDYLRAEKNAAYEASKAKWGETPIEPSTLRQVGDAFMKARDSVIDRRTGEWKVSPEEAAKINEIQTVMNQWDLQGKGLTAEGLDNLKQRLSAISTGTGHTQLDRIVNSVGNSIRDVIGKADTSGEYVKAMSDYSNSMDTIREVERSLSLGDASTVDTALRKLQSLTRGNAGARTASAEKLAEVGADVMPAVAGQTLSPWLPKGLARQVIGGNAVVLNPTTAALAPFFSPRFVGAAAYRAGQARHGARYAADLLRRGTNKVADKLAEQASKQIQSGVPPEDVGTVMHDTARRVADEGLPPVSLSPAAKDALLVGGQANDREHEALVAEILRRLSSHEQ